MAHLERWAKKEMKTSLVLILALVLSSSGYAESPAFIKVGGVYAFLLAGRNPVSDKLIASVLKDEGSGWLRISTIEKKEELWINLGQVQAILPVSGDADVLRVAMQQKKILSNLREIAAGVAQFSLETGKAPKSVDDIVGAGKVVRPLESVAGEDYRTIDISGDAPLRVRTNDGAELVYPRK